MSPAIMVVCASLGAQAQPLELEEVLASATQHAPQITVAAQKVRAAEGELLSAQGGFDLMAKGKAGAHPTGAFGEQTAELSLTQATTVWGTSLFAGYRFGNDFPLYGAKGATSSAGELMAGLHVPLWRDGPIDERRVDRIRGEVSVEAAKHELIAKQLLIREKAAHAYWKWIASVAKLQIAEGMLSLAEARELGIRAQIDGGQLAQIELVDNQRVIVDRREEIVGAQREVQAAAIALSLFLRDREGRPIVASVDRAAALPPPGALDALTFEQGLLRGRDERPEPTVLRASMERARAELALWENQEAPQVDLMLAVSKDFGPPQPYGPDPSLVTKNQPDVGLTLSFAWPVQQRKARGKSVTARAKLEALKANQVLIQDVIRAEIQDAWSALEAARTQAELAREAHALTQRVEVAERKKLDLGDSNVLTVNIREEHTAKAAKKIVDAQLAYHRARATFDAVSAAPLFDAR